MANEKISQLPAASTSSNGDLYPLVQSGANYSITFTALQTALAAAVTPGQLPTITLTGNITGSGSGGTIATTITNSSVTNSKLANMANNTIKGNVSGISAAPSDLSGSQVTAILSLFASGAQGVVPASGGGVTNFLRADGTWAPATGEGVTTVGTIDTEGPSSDGATITGNDIYMQSASVTEPGLVNTAIQAFTGGKTFVAAGDNTALIAQAGTTGQTADILQIKETFHSSVTSGFDNKGFLFFAQAITRASPPSLERDQELGFFVDTNQLGLFNGSTWFQAVNGPTTSVTNGISVFSDTTGSIIQGTSATIDGSGNFSTPGTIAGQTAAQLAAAVAAADYQSHIIYVDTTSGNDSNLGGPSTPLETIGAAMTMIGSATSPSDFNNAATAYWVVEIAPGIYTENVTVPTRQIIQFNLNAVQINGNVTQTLVDSVVSGTIAYTKLIFKGSDLRPSYTGASIPLTGINGNLTLNGSNSNFYTAQLIQTGVSGNVVFNGDFPSGLFMSDSMVVGTISTTGSGGQLDLIVSNADTSSSKSIGGLTGNIVMEYMRNVHFAGPVITTNTVGGHWSNTSFVNSGSNDFTGSTATISADANSISNFLANVTSGNRGSFTFTYLDQAQGVGYTPTTPGDWSPVPTTVQGALDELITSAGGGVTGPGSSVSGDIATFNGTTGKVIQDSGIKIDGSKNITGVNTISAPRSASGPVYFDSNSSGTGFGFYTGSGSDDECIMWSGGVPLVVADNNTGNGPAFVNFAARIVGIDGSQYDPTYGWENNGELGFYRSATNVIMTTIGSVNTLSFSASGISILSVGSGLTIAEGSNAKAGVATLSAGTITIANTSVTANTRVLLTVQTPGGVQGFLSAPTNPGTGFTINSSSVTETSVVYWLLIEHT